MFVCVRGPERSLERAGLSGLLVAFDGLRYRDGGNGGALPPVNRRATELIL